MLDHSIDNFLLVASINDSCLLGLDFMVANETVIEARNHKVICGKAIIAVKVDY